MATITLPLRKPIVFYFCTVDLKSTFTKYYDL